ncbi:hypothetical protein EW145_g7635, partial [Phellinidium pouzarii]
MHTQHNGGINQNLVSELKQNFTVQPVLTSSFSSDSLEDITPEDISMAELDEAFDSVAAAPTDFREGVDTTTGLVVKDRFDGTVDAAAVFDLSELDKILQGDTPIFVAEDHQVHHRMDGSAEIWDVDSLKAQADTKAYNRIIRRKLGDDAFRAIQAGIVDCLIQLDFDQSSANKFKDTNLVFSMETFWKAALSVPAVESLLPINGCEADKCLKLLKFNSLQRRKDLSYEIRHTVLRELNKSLQRAVNALNAQKEELGVHVVERNIKVFEEKYKCSRSILEDCEAAQKSRGGRLSARVSRVAQSAYSRRNSVREPHEGAVQGLGSVAASRQSESVQTQPA